jgi:hypothetical protein
MAEGRREKLGLEGFRDGGEVAGDEGLDVEAKAGKLRAFVDAV